MFPTKNRSRSYYATAVSKLPSLTDQKNTAKKFLSKQERPILKSHFHHHEKGVQPLLDLTPKKCVSILSTFDFSTLKSAGELYLRPADVKHQSSVLMKVPFDESSSSCHTNFNDTSLLNSSKPKPPPLKIGGLSSRSYSGYRRRHMSGASKQSFHPHDKKQCKSKLDSTDSSVGSLSYNHKGGKKHKRKNGDLEATYSTETISKSITTSTGSTIAPYTGYTSQAESKPSNCRIKVALTEFEPEELELNQAEWLHNNGQLQKESSSVEEKDGIRLTREIERKEAERKKVMERLKHEVEGKRTLHRYKEAVMSDFYELVDACDEVDYQYIRYYGGKEYMNQIKDNELQKVLLFEQSFMESFELKKNELLLKLKQAHQQFTERTKAESSKFHSNAVCSFLFSYFDHIPD